jgi:hypothetical protein
MSILNYYNKETKTLTLPYNFNEKLKDIPEETEKIIFHNYSYNYSHGYYSLFNQSVDNLPLSLTHLTFGRQTPVRLAHPKIFIIFEMTLF